jgi:2-keto-4-pentenoate hydratase/2-oxohepta-3-ene-1,7-dioic acid hydratase in catechol pathway
VKLARFGNSGGEKPALVDARGQRRDCSALAADFDRDFFRSGGLSRLAALSPAELDALPEVSTEARWGAPVARPGKVLCIGLNYLDHAKESGMPVPGEPIVFMKGSNCVVGPYDDLVIPRGSRKTDWEVELGVVIGKDARYLDSVNAAAAHVAGYCVSHDVSEREFQLERGGQWTKGKSADTFNPLGPYLVTPEQAGDVKKLSLTLDVNGERRQSGNTGNMVFDVFFLVHYLSQFMTLEAGDLISTGTPPGVGMGLKPPVFLEPGDVVELAIDGLGSQRQRCRAYSAE